MALAGAEILLLKGKSDVVVKKIAVTSEQITFGNHPLNTVRVHQEQVERLHCRIALNKANVVELTNLSKLCPVRVNGETVTKKVQLKDGDLFAVAGCQFRWSYDVTSSNKVSKKRGSTKHFTRKHSADDLSYAVAKPQTRKTKVLFEFSRHRRTIHSLQSVLDQHEATHGKKRLQTPAKPPAEMLQVASHEEYEKENTPVKNTVNTPKKNQQLNTSSVMILSYTPLQSEKERRHVGCKTPNVADKPVRLVQTPLVSTSMLGSPMNVSKGGDSMYLVDLTTPTSKSVSRSNASSAVSGAKGRLLGTINLVSPSPKSTTPVSIRGRNGSALLKSAIKNAHITKGSMCGTPNTPKLSARNKLLARSGCKSADRQSTHTRIVPGNSIKKDLMKKMTAEDPSKDPFANEDAPRNTDPSIDLTEDCIDNELPVAVDTLCSEQIVPPTLSDVPAFDIEAVIKKPNFTRQIRCSNFSDITPDASYTENNADIETNENQTQEHRENTIIASWSVESELKTVSDRPIVKTTERKSYTPFAHKPLLSERSKRATIGHFGNNVYQTLVVSPVSVTEFKPDSSQRILIEPVPANDNEGVCDEQALLESPNDDDAAFVDDYDEDELLKSDSESFQSSKKINAEFNVPASPHLRVSLRDTRKFIGSAFTSLNTSRPQLDLTAEIDESLIVNDDDDDEDIINQKYDLTHLGEGAGIVASKDEMTQCVQRRSSETSSIIDKSKEATLRAAERIDLESDDEIDNETSYSSMNVSSTNQDDELMDGITLIPPTPPNEGEHDSSYEDNMEPCRSLSEIEENICGDSINKIIDSSISSASLEIDRETSAGLTMVRNQSAIEIMKPVLISESANNTIEASFPEAIVEVDRESSVAQTMDQKHSEIEIVEFKPNSDSANENVDSNLTPAAVEVDRESLAGQKMDQSQSEIEVVESELAGQKMDQSQSEIEVVESELAGQKMDQSQSEIEVVESELISDSANKSNGASVTEPAVKVDRESLAGQKMDQSQSEIEVVESELISDSANKSIGANFIEPAVEIYQGSLAGQKMDQSQSEIEVVESELISDSANKSIGASFIEPAVEIDRESLAGQKMDQSQSEIEVVESELISDSANKSIGASFIEPAVEIDRESLAGQKMDQSQPEIEVVESELISDSANKSNGASVTEPAVEIDRGSLAGQKMDQSQSEIEVVESELAGQKMDQSQSGIEVVESELISDSANKSIGASFIEPAVEIDRGSLAGQKMDQSQSEIEVVESELISVSANKSIGASFIEPAVEIDRGSLAGQKMDQSQSEIEVVESELISDSANKNIGASFIEPAVEIDRGSLAGQKMDQSQSEIKVVESELAGQKMDQSQSGIEVVESELISDSANKSIGANFIEPAVEIDRESLAGQKMDQSQPEIEVVESELISDSANKSNGASVTEPAVKVDRESLAGQKMDQSQSEIEVVESELAGQKMDQSQSGIEVVESELISDSANKSIGASFIEPAVEIDRGSLAGQKMDQSQSEIEVVESELISDSANKSIGANFIEPAVEIDRESLAGQKMDQSQPEIEVVESELISDSANKSNGASVTEPAVKVDRESLAGQKMDQSQSEIEVVESELISDSANKSIGASFIEPAVEIDRGSLAGQKMDQSQSEIEVVESELAGQKMDQSQSEIEVVESELISDSANKSIGANFIELAVEIDRESLAGQKMDQSQSEIEVVESELISDSANKSIGANFIEPAVEIDRESLARQKMDQRQSEIEIVESKPNSDSTNENVDSSLMPAAVEVDQELSVAQMMDQTHSETEVVESEPNSNSCYETVDSRFAPGNVAVDLQSSALVVTAASSPSDKIINITKKRKLFSKTDPLTLIINTDSPPQRLLESKYPEYVIENRAVSGKQKNKKDDTFTLNSSPKKSPIQRRQLPSRAARNRIVTLSEEELAGKSPKVKYCKPKNNTLSDSSSNNDFMKLDEKRKIIFNDIVDIKEFNSPNIEGDIIKKTKTRRVKDLNENPQKDINPLTKEGHEEPAEFIQPLKDNAVTSTPRGSTKLDLNSTKTKICMPPESPAIRRTRRMGTVLVDSPVLLTPSSTSAELSVDTKELAVQDKILEESSQVLTPNSGKSNQTKTRSTRSRKQLTVPGVTKISEEFIYNVKEPNTNNVSSEKSANKAKEGIENDDKTQEDTQLHEELPKKKGRKGKQTPIRSAKLDLKESLEEEIEKTNIDMQNLKPESPKKVGRKRRAKDAGSTEVKDLEPEYLYEQRTSKQAKHYEKSEEPDLVHNSTTEKQSETNIPKKRGNKKKIPHEETVDTKEKQTTKEETNHTPAKEQHFESKPPAKKGRTLKRDTYKDEPAVTEKSRLAVAKSDRLSEGEPKEERTDKSNLEEELPRKRGRKKKIAENVSVELTIECPADAESKGENLKADTAVEDLPKKRGRKMKMVQDEPIETKKIQSAKQKTIDPIQEKAGDEIDQQDTKKRGKTSKKQVGPSPGKSSTEPNVMNAENGVRTRSRRAKQAV
ncbi:uncharacterized protein LOC118461493 isoform X28 [Anopheles albimanus]|uniref:uncharacterized protein LOC118461493 isoform X26 n=1 Tax=Anopheles albimanus TaxID=7167 RepID=UPI00163F01B5|nr:uncharacterized protein LOC118461493 isoform X26 [Anopheles albimanus]XP_035782799.1 uncharacterized protein LOC118461493 isoform X28 [Anopheles albimanus]